MPTEVSPGSLGDIDLVGDDAVIGTGLDTLPGTVDVLDSLLHVTFDIEGETGSFRDGETEVKSDTSGNTSETDEETPAVVDGDGVCGRLGQDGVLVGGNDNEGNEAGGC